jgi:aminoglycoside phosphotransferase (APT) family kinase protein
LIYYIKNIVDYIDELFYKFKSTTTVFVHWDLQPKNIIINLDNNIKGIIDFSDSKIGSPELDFCHLLDNNSLIKEAIEIYLWNYDKDFYERIFFLWRRDVIFEILNDDIYHNNFSAIVDNLEKYKFLP